MGKEILNESLEKLLDKYRGCIVGGAVGDALGYAVEFSSEDSISKIYGEHGITEYELIDGVAQISDDTQMTLFTANGLLLGTTRGKTRGIMGKYSDYIALCYGEWYKMQWGEYPLEEKYPYTWLVNIPQLYENREPGHTCLSALASFHRGAKGTIEEPINDSKGCGGIMRVAPIGIYFGGKRISIEDVDMIAAESAAITHGHDLGYIPAAALVHIIHLVSHDKDITLLEAVNDMIEKMQELFANARHIIEFTDLMEQAVTLSQSDMKDIDAIHMLGEGWVAEETLAIAIYCALKYSTDFKRAIIAAVNHKGDSDSTGAVTGNILGAYLGMSAIPSQYIENLELKDIILELADDLYNDCKISEYSSYRDEIWEKKYIDKTYKKKEENMSKITLLNASCADQTVDAVVNAANDGLWAGGGICGVIFKKAGLSQLTAACKQYKTPLKDGSAVITPAFNMTNAKYIIHAVGPNFSVTPTAFKELFDAYYNSLVVLMENDLHSISFPLISSGIFGGKLDNPAAESTKQCCRAYNKFIADYPDYHIDVKLCAFSANEMQKAQAVFESYFG